jgi:membrane peptidoglycan carboxypeptidase
MTPRSRRLIGRASAVALAFMVIVGLWSVVDWCRDTAGILDAVRATDTPDQLLEHFEVRVLGRPLQGHVALRDMPQPLLSALLLQEDQTFMDHEGVSAEATLRSLRADLRAGSFRFGGSTITQQIAKNFFLQREKTVSRKLRDMAIALVLETKFTKHDLLWAYLNSLEGPDSAYGIAEIAARHFGKEPRALTLRESFAIVLAVPAPARLLRGPSDPATAKGCDALALSLYRQGVLSFHGYREYLNGGATLPGSDE